MVCERVFDKKTEIKEVSAGRYLTSHGEKSETVTTAVPLPALVLPTKKFEGRNTTVGPGVGGRGMTVEGRDMTAWRQNYASEALRRSLPLRIILPPRRHILVLNILHPAQTNKHKHKHKQTCRHSPGHCMVLSKFQGLYSRVMYFGSCSLGFVADATCCWPSCTAWSCSCLQGPSYPPQ